MNKLPLEHQKEVNTYNFSFCQYNDKLNSQNVEFRIYSHTISNI